ncbi:hypothetical protein [Streptomyces sp. NRRL F-5727]|uniref:hypothetical protein n=1 Tax=Streptomyces sp. NRRL F-5727 TaxID=1463871 RepID=UPI00131BBECA|nr:hypothetical protein [Streptomyces sp. NRRL F-5727]
MLAPGGRERRFERWGAAPWAAPAVGVSVPDHGNGRPSADLTPQAALAGAADRAIDAQLAGLLDRHRV